MSRVTPLFKSHYSMGRSILTLEEAGESKPSQPDSIIDIALENKLEKVVLIEDGMSGFLEAYTNCMAAKLHLIYGVRISFCNDVSEKSEESLSKTSKFVILIKNWAGYQRMIKLFKLAYEQGFYYEPRLDFKVLKQFWNDSDLVLCIPFYDSFLFKNLFTVANCVPDFSFAKPCFIIEDNELWFDEYLRDKVQEYCKSNSLVSLEAQSVYYKNRADFKAYLTFRCINNRTQLSKPNLEHMTSDSFCLENWKSRNE